MRTPSLRSVLATALIAIPALLALAACDATDPALEGPPPLDTLPSDQQALVVQAFQDVEALFDLGLTGNTAATLATCCGGDKAPPPEPPPFRTSAEHSLALASPLAGDRGSALEPHAGLDWRAWIGALATGTDDTSASASDPARLAVAPDTTLYTGIYDTANTKGYLAVLNYREPQGVGIWSARLQHARAVDHDSDPGTAQVDAVETVDLTFLTHADLSAFLTALEGGTNAYMTGASGDAEAAFTSATIDVWRVAQVYSPFEGGAVVTYANAELRETVTIRDPIITVNVDGTGTVRDGGTAGSARTRYYGADFAVTGDGSFSGTLLRTLQSRGDTADGALVSRTDYALDGTYLQTRQRGGNGVVIRENSEG